MTVIFSSRLYGHQHVRDRLIQQMEGARPQQSFIFSGPPGIGKCTTALFIARHCLCEKGEPGGCGHCSTCRCFSTPWVHHPDLTVFAPATESVAIPRQALMKELDLGPARYDELLEQAFEQEWLSSVVRSHNRAHGLDLIQVKKEYLFEKATQSVFPNREIIDKSIEKMREHEAGLAKLIYYLYSSIPRAAYATTLRVDSVRFALIDSMSSRPYSAPRKVFILDGAENLTPGAQNSLLKTLEEPPETVIIILITRALHLLLPTVRSRCRTVLFSPLSRENSVALLQEITGWNAEEANYHSLVSDGNTSVALKLDRTMYGKLFRDVLLLLGSLKKYDMGRLQDDSDTLLRFSDTSKDDTAITGGRVLERLLGTLIRLKTGMPPKDIDSSKLTFFTRMCNSYSLEELVFLAERFTVTCAREDNNVQARQNMVRFLIESVRFLSSGRMN